MTHSTFPNDGEVVRRMEEIEEWRKYINRVLFSVIFGAMGTILSFGIWVGTIQTAASHNHESITTIDIDHRDYANRIGRLEVNNSEIKTKLVNIEATLQEIKLAITKLR